MKVVITDHRFPNVDQERTVLDSLGAELLVPQTTEENVLLDLCRDADAVLTVRAKITKRIIDSMRNCRIIVRYGIGVDNVDIAAATARNIMVARVPDYCVDEVSDHALTLILMLSRQVFAATELAREDKWMTSKMPPLHRLNTQVCGLFGAGHIGSLLIPKLRALGMKVLVHDPYLDAARAQSLGVELVDKPALLQRSDFISIHAPLAEATRHAFNAETLSQMKPTAYIVNTSRGGLIDEAALLRAIDGGTLAGAALDVLESETEMTPIRTALVHHPKIIVTAHTAWLSKEARSSLQKRAIMQVVACFRGERPYGLVNPEIFSTVVSAKRPE